MSEPTFWPPLRRADQSFVAGLVLVALLAMAGYWLHGGGHHGLLIDIDQVEPLSADFRVDVNSASWPELTQLPGVGETLARRIVQSRERDGPFQHHDDLERIHGLGPILIDRMRPFLLPIGESAGKANEE